MWQSLTLTLKKQRRRRKSSQKSHCNPDRLHRQRAGSHVEEVVKELGGLDFCHNNAGICINAPAEEMTYEQWLKVININQY